MLERAPVEVVNEDGRSSVVLLCEHASNYVPPEYDRLGLCESELERHIAWDIGAAEVTRHLSRHLDAPAFLATHSRLLIDLNRHPHAASSIPVRSEATEIPGNCELAEAERTRRQWLLFEPFHERIRRHLDRRRGAGRKTLLLLIHSFSPVYLACERPWHAGVLFENAEELGHSMIASLRRDPALVVEANVPYVVEAGEDYGLIVHGDERDVPAALVEIRNDLIAASDGAEEWAERLAEAALSFGR